MVTLSSVPEDITSGADPSGDTVSEGPSGNTMPTDPSGDTGPVNTSDSGDSSDTSEGSTMPPAPGAPVFLSLQTNVSKITAGESVTFTAVLTDPDGVEDIVGGTLSDPSGAIGYGPFVAAGQEGTYSISISWDAMQQAEAIYFEATDLGRMFRAEFYDQAANKVSMDVNLTLTCDEGSACDGVCTDLMTNDAHCGTCNKECEGGCDAGFCAPKWGACIDMNSGFATCSIYCASLTETCVESGCGPNEGTVFVFYNSGDCEAHSGDGSLQEPCDAVQTWGFSRTVVKCCCSDTK